MWEAGSNVIGTNAERAGLVDAGPSWRFYESDTGLTYIRNEAGNAWLGPTSVIGAGTGVANRLAQWTGTNALTASDIIENVTGSTLQITAALTGARTLTLPDANVTITGGGTLALGTFTLTVPATGTCVLGGGAGAANCVAYWTDANTLSNRSSFADNGTTVTINRNSAVALRVEQDGVFDDVLCVDTQNGRVGINTYPIGPLHLAKTGANAILYAQTFRDSASEATAWLSDKARGTQAVPVIVQSGDTLGRFYFRGYDGGAMREAGYISMEVDGAPGLVDMPGRFMFYTTPDGSATPTFKATLKHNGYWGLGVSSPQRLSHIQASDTATATITYAARVSHTTSNTAAALFGVGEEHDLEDAAGNMQVASEQVTLWATATSGAESPLLRWTTYPIGVAGPGYCGFWTWNDLDNNARTVIPNGTGDVVGAITIHYTVVESGGGYSGSIVVIPNGGNAAIYDDGTDVFTVTVNADGSVTIARSAGATTADVALLMTWA